jgi:prepilin-type N-terminal cleavage/methylation domain-containing protein
MNINRKDNGFTIIEVVLVLAIAGLIFLMVFIALPALQRGQRDTQRKNDLSRAITAINSYTSSNRGALPTNWTTFTTSYLTTSGDTFIDPAGANTGNPTATTYTFTARTVAQGALTGAFSAATNQNVIYYTTGATCGTSNDAVAAAGSRKVAFRMYLEGGGFACQNN